MRGDHIASIAEAFVGCSLDHRRDELAALVCTSPKDDADRIVRIETNCAMFVRGVLNAAGVVHPILEAPYRSGRAVGDVREIALRYGALVPFTGQVLSRGTILRYHIAGKNDDHVEILLEDASHGLGWEAEHCGGGRKRNAITSELSDVRRSYRRPLVEVVDPDLLLEFL